MTNEARIRFYVRDLTYKTADGIYRLTPAQRSRVRHKHNHMMRKEDGELFDPGGWGYGDER